MTLPLKKAGREPVAEVRFFADDPRALVARAREQLTAGSSSAGSDQSTSSTWISDE
ncbi:MAG: hypothetical protein ACRDWY_17735 [Actinomycetes bacterium]